MGGYPPMKNQWQIPKITVHKKLLMKLKDFNRIWWSWCYYNEEKMFYPARWKKITVDQSKVLKNRLFRYFWATRYMPIVKTPIPQRARPLKDRWKTMKLAWSFNGLSMNFQWSPRSFTIPGWSFSGLCGLRGLQNFLKRFKTVFQRSFRKMVFQQSFSDLSMNFQRSY